VSSEKGRDYPVLEQRRELTYLLPLCATKTRHRDLASSRRPSGLLIKIPGNTYEKREENEKWKGGDKPVTFWKRA